jgi:hypothetical protein
MERRSSTSNPFSAVSTSARPRCHSAEQGLVAGDESEHFSAEIVHTKRAGSGSETDLMKMRE